MNLKIAAVIPARMASTRFPGKPLISIQGLAIIEHVRRRVLLCKGFSDVVVATCDREIYDCVTSFGGRVVMTSAKHQVATERVIEAVKEMDCTHVINVQGDEVLVLPSNLDAMIAAIQARPENKAWNAVARLEKAEDLQDRSIVKCLLSQTKQMLYCSRSFSHLPLESIYWVIGLLGYSRKFLEEFQKLSKTPLEQLEFIEQLRLLENDIPIASVLFKKAYPGINEPREVTLVQKYLKEDSLQREVLKKIL